MNDRGWYALVPSISVPRHAGGLSAEVAATVEVPEIETTIG